MTARLICPGCGRELAYTERKGEPAITCFKVGCENEDKCFKLPEIEVEEYEDRDSKKQD